MSDNDTSVDQEDEQKDLDEDQQDEGQVEDQGQNDKQDDQGDDEGQKSEDPLDNIDDVDEMRETAKKYRGIASRKSSKPQEKKPEQKDEKPAEPAKPADGQVTLTPMDAIILSKANISDQEDIEELISFAGYRKITVAQALKDKTMQTILHDRAEQRETAEATNVDGGRRGSSKPAAEQVLADAEKGKFPDDPAELAKARAASKRKNKK